MKSIATVFFFLCLWSSALAWKHFRNGKHWKLEKADIGQDFPPDQWFEQRLDHFNLINNETWQQVGIFFNRLFENVLNHLVCRGTSRMALSFTVTVQSFCRSEVREKPAPNGSFKE